MARQAALPGAARSSNGHFSNYQRIADQVMAVLGDFTPLVQRISIDEAFLDVSGSVHLFGPAEVIGVEIRRRVRSEIGLPISVGAARTKHLAKVASQVAKPDGLVVVDPAHEPGVPRPAPGRARLGDRPGHPTEARRAGIAPSASSPRPPTTPCGPCSARCSGPR